MKDFFLNCDWIRVSDSCPYNAQTPNSHILHRKKLEARGTWFIKDKHRVLAELTPELCSPCPLTTVGRLLLIHRLFSSASDRTAASQQITKINEQFMSRNKTHWIKHTFNCRDPGLFVPRLRGTGEGRAAHGETLAQLPPSALSSSAATVLPPGSQSLQPYKTNSATKAYIPTLSQKAAISTCSILMGNKIKWNKKSSSSVTWATFQVLNSHVGWGHDTGHLRSRLFPSSLGELLSRQVQH